MIHRMHLVVSFWLLATQIHAVATASDILKDSGVRGGLVVVVGCEDCELLVALGKQKGYLVHGLDTQNDHIEKATAALQAKGLCGRVSVARFDGRALPYVENLVNLIVVSSGEWRVASEEIERVLAPGGAAMIGEGENKRLFVAGAKGDWVISQDAYEGRMDSVLRVISIDDGRIIAEDNLPGLPIFDGMPAARGRLYISLAHGRVVCLGADATQIEVD